MADEYDSPWKEILEQYFEQFMALFFPQAHAEIDWARGYEFKDKEFQQITKEADTRRRYVDKLVKVWMIDGSEAWGLIHTDIQNWPEMDFAERMYIYNYRIFDRFRRPVASLAVLGGIPKTRTVNRYDRSLWGCYQQFGFPVVNLNDFAARMEELKASSNPFAVVVMAYNLARQMRRQKTACRRVLRIIRYPRLPPEQPRHLSLHPYPVEAPLLHSPYNFHECLSFSKAPTNMPPPQGLKGTILRFLGFRLSTNMPPPQGLKGIILRFLGFRLSTNMPPPQGLKAIF